MKWRVLGAVLLLVGCARSVENCRCDAEAAQAAMCRVLREINSGEELRSALPQLRRFYLEIAQLMMSAETAYDCAEWAGIDHEPEVSVQLRQELMRIYQLDGGQELMEEAQEDALLLLARAESEGILRK